MKLSISFAATVLGLAVGASATFPGFRGVTEGNNSCELTASTGEDTCSSRRFCQLPVGECRKRIAVFSGTCARAPSSCTYEWDPVCGCDGETYGNECEAYANSVSVQSYGECDSGRSRVGDSCSRSTDGADTCNGGLFCELPDGECRKRIDPHSGTCQKYPKSCTYNYDPVCGCDGKTYANKCEALANGVSVSSNGECGNNNRTPNSSKAPCQVGSKARMPCTDSKEYCQLEEGGCIYNTKNADGICIVKPSACTANFDPVCGCDYNTYDNECQAAAAGVSVRRKGSCERDEAEFLLA